MQQLYGHQLNLALSDKPHTENSGGGPVKFNSDTRLWKLAENGGIHSLCRSGNAVNKHQRESVAVDKRLPSGVSAKKDRQFPALNLARYSVVPTQAEKAVVILVVSDKPVPAASLDDPIPQMEQPERGDGHA